MEGEKKLFSISKDNSITGQDLYDSLFEAVTPDEKVEIVMSGKEGLIGNDRIIFDRLNELINKICAAINKANGQNSLE